MVDTTKTAGMREATRLIAAGQLHEAVAIIKRTLQGAPAVKPETDPPRTATNTSPEGRCSVSDEPMGSHTHEALRRPLFDMARLGLATAAGTRRPQQQREYRRPRPWSEPIPGQDNNIVPDGGRFTSGSYANHAGTRSYKLYVPSGYHGQPLPLVVMLHGCTQNPDDFAAGTRMNALAEEHQCFVAYPAQAPAANSSKCWNWFEAGNQQRDRGEPSIIAGITRQIVANHRVDTRRIYVAGLSAGGAMAVTLAITYPDLYAAVGIHSGLPYAVAQDLPSAFTAMHGGAAASVRQRSVDVPGTFASPVSAIVFHGDQDATVHPCNGEQVIAQCAPSYARRGESTPRVIVEQGQVPLGHAYTRTTYHGANGYPVVEHWLVHGAGHAWSGGSSRGSYTDTKGPNASQEMLRFFFEHPQGEVTVEVD